MAKKFEKLENYIEEIDHYLAVDKDVEDILTEIRDHILEKTEQENGKIDEEGIGNIIANYGSPKAVAEKYLDGTHIIAPSYRKHLFRYTKILFIIHFSIICLAYVFKTGLYMFPPLFSIPRVDNFFELLSQFPMTLIYDFGLIALLLFLISQMKNKINLPWPKFFTKSVWRKKNQLFTPVKPTWYGLSFWILCLTVVISVFVHFDTLFFYSLNVDNPKPLFTPMASTFYSLIIIASVGIELICYLVRFFSNTFWVDVIKNAIFLAILWVIINFPLNSIFNDFPYFDLGTAASWVLSVLVIIYSLETFSFIYKLIRNRLHNIKNN